MADTKRTTILKALKTAITSTGYFRTVGRYHPAPHTVGNLPAAFLYPVEEDTESGTDDQIKKKLRIIVLVIVQSGSNLSDEAEQAIAKIEAIIETNPSISGTVNDSRVLQIDLDISEAGKPKAYVFITVECDYQRERG